MRSGRAYITSFGTTGLLVAASLLVLLLVGALMAFKGVSDADKAQDVPSVLVPPVQATGDTALQGVADAPGDREAAPARAARSRAPGRSRERSVSGEVPLAGLGPAPVSDIPGGGGALAPSPASPEPAPADTGAEPSTERPPPSTPEPLVQAGQTLQQTTQGVSGVIQGAIGALPRPEASATPAAASLQPAQ